MKKKKDPSLRIKRRSIFVNGITVVCAGLILLYFYRSVIPTKQSTLLNYVIDSVGLAIVFFGQLLRISARGYKSGRIEKDTSVITTGPYELVRHPMYFGSFLIGLGIVILLLRIWMVPVYVLFYLLWYREQIYTEEKYLAQKFGQTYLDYSQITPRFFPHIRVLLGPNLKEYIPLKSDWIKKEWGTILTWVLVMVFFKSCYELQWYGVAAMVKKLIFLLLLILCFAAFAFAFREKQ